MEESGCIGNDSGWEACHLLVRDPQGTLVAAVPNYLKDHSYGEFVFDWSWANAYHQNRLNYYPKMLTAMPYTPCAGPRIVVRPTADSGITDSDLTQFCVNQLIGLASQNGLSSWHMLFPQEELVDELAQKSSLLKRIGSQFHWYNRDYQTFDDYLGAMKARKRNSVKKERRKVADAGITFRHVHGTEITAAELNDFYVFYHATYMKRGMRGYLNREFFELVVAHMPENTLFIIAEIDGRAVANAMFFVGGDTIYGRYWGCLEEYKNLHFETSYYQGIKYCIDNGMRHFDAGAQGEHKIQRGFEPIETYSLHWIAHPAFHEAFANFLDDENPYIQDYIEAAATYLPFKQTDQSNS